MNPRIRLVLIFAWIIGALAALFYAWLFEQMLEPSLPIIPLAGAALALLCAGAAGFEIAELFADMEGAKK